MTDIESRLRSLPTLDVPVALDADIEAVIRAAELLDTTRSGGWRIPSWIAVAACTACAALGFAAHALLTVTRPGPLPTTVYVIEPTPAFSRWMGVARAPRGNDLFSKEVLTVEDLYVAGTPSRQTQEGPKNDV